MPKLSSRVMAIALAVLLAVGCGDEGDGGPGDIDIQDFVAVVSTLDGSIEAIFNVGDPPSPSGGPTVTVDGGETGITGGSVQVNLSATAEFVTIIIAIDGVDGYWTLTIPATTAIEILLMFAADVPQENFDLLYQVMTAGGAAGAVTEVSTDVIEVGTGQVQVSVSWDAASDVDLHLVEPSGEEIYWADRESATGGQLDLDSNPACDIDNVNNENISWSGSAPRGEYVVRVDYYDGCGVEETDYVVTVRVEGRQPQTFTGTFTGSGDQGGPGSGVEITRFTF